MVFLSGTTTFSYPVYLCGDIGCGAKGLARYTKRTQLPATDKPLLSCTNITGATCVLGMLSGRSCPQGAHILGGDRLTWAGATQDTEGYDGNTWADLREVSPVLSCQGSFYSFVYISLTSGMPFIILVGGKEEAVAGPGELGVPHSNCCSLP